MAKPLFIILAVLIVAAGAVIVILLQPFQPPLPLPAPEAPETSATLPSTTTSTTTSITTISTTIISTTTTRPAVPPAAPEYTGDFDLSDFPALFLEGGETTFIVGEEGSVLDVATLSDLFGDMQAMADSSGPIGENILDTELDDFDEGNLIVIGDACTNTIVAELYGNPWPCEDAFPAGFGVLKLFDTGTYTALVIGGNTPERRQDAAEALVNYDDYPGFTGEELWVSGTRIMTPVGDASGSATQTTTTAPGY